MSTVTINTNNKKTIIPKNFKSTLPPRKRAKTKEEKEQRRIERIMRNRRAARKSRERKRLYMESMEEKLKIYDEIFKTLNIDQQLNEHHPILLNKLNSFNDKSKQLLSSDDEDENDNENESDSNHSPNSISSNLTSNTLIEDDQSLILLKQEIENDNIEMFLSKIKKEEEDSIENQDFSFDQFPTIANETYNTPKSLTDTSSNLQMQWFDSMNSNPLQSNQTTSNTISQDPLSDFLNSPIDWELMRNPAVYL